MPLLSESESELLMLLESEPELLPLLDPKPLLESESELLLPLLLLLLLLEPEPELLEELEVSLSLSLELLLLSLPLLLELLLPDDDELPRFFLFFFPLPSFDAAAAGLVGATRCRKLPAASVSGSSSEGSRYRCLCKLTYETHHLWPVFENKNRRENTRCRQVAGCFRLWQGIRGAQAPLLLRLIGPVKPSAAGHVLKRAACWATP